MPKGFEKLKARIKAEHPSMKDEDVEMHAAKMWNHMMKGTGQTVGRGMDEKRKEMHS